jgi:hypothetical protein
LNKKLKDYKEKFAKLEKEIERLNKLNASLEMFRDE